jgi:hypothetical protein
MEHGEEIIFLPVTDLFIGFIGRGIMALSER